MSNQASVLPGGIFVVDDISGLPSIGEEEGLAAGDVVWIRSLGQWYVYLYNPLTGLTTWTLTTATGVGDVTPDGPTPPRCILKKTTTSTSTTSSSYSDIPVLQMTSADLTVGQYYLFQLTCEMVNTVFGRGAVIAIFNNGTIVDYTERAMINDYNSAYLGNFPCVMSTHGMFQYNGGAVQVCFREVYSASGAGYNGTATIKRATFTGLNVKN